MSFHGAVTVKKMSLDEKKIGVVDQNKIVEYRYSEKDVKQFIKELKGKLLSEIEGIKAYAEGIDDNILKIIDEASGKGLI